MRYRQRPEPFKPKSLSAAQFTGDVSSLAAIRDVAKECDADADVELIPVWGIAIVRWKFYGAGAPNEMFTHLHVGDWLVYFDLNDAMGEIGDRQFREQYERIGE